MDKGRKQASSQVCVCVLNLVNMYTAKHSITVQLLTPKKISLFTLSGLMVQYVVHGTSQSERGQNLPTKESLETLLYYTTPCTKNLAGYLWTAC